MENSDIGQPKSVEFVFSPNDTHPLIGEKITEFIQDSTGLIPLIHASTFLMYLSIL